MDDNKQPDPRSGRPDQSMNDRERAANPDLAALVDAAKGDDGAPRKGGRPKGAKSRKGIDIAAARAASALGRKGAEWWDRILSESPYLALQLLKKLLPNRPPERSEGDEPTEIKIRYVRQDAIGREIESDADPYSIGSPSPTLPSAASDAPMSAEPSAPVTPQRVANAEAAPKSDGKPERVFDYQSVVDAMIRRAEDKADQTPGTVAYRRLLARVAAGIGFNLATAEARAKQESTRLKEIQARLNRQRMFNDPDCWEGDKSYFED